MLRELAVADLTIEDPPIEDVIEHVFASALPADEPPVDPEPIAEAAPAEDPVPRRRPTPSPSPRRPTA